jgi:hypothetical protein
LKVKFSRIKSKGILNKVIIEIRLPAENLLGSQTKRNLRGEKGGNCTNIASRWRKQEQFEKDK